MGNGEKLLSDFFGPHTSSLAMLPCRFSCAFSLPQHQDPNDRSHINPDEKSVVC